MSIETRFSPVEDFIGRWEKGDLHEEDFGKELRNLRRRMRVSIRELAQTANLTMATLSNVERGNRQARIDSLTKIFKALRSIEKQRQAQ